MQLNIQRIRMNLTGLNKEKTSVANRSPNEVLFDPSPPGSKTRTEALCSEDLKVSLME